MSAVDLFYQCISKEIRSCWISQAVTWKVTGLWISKPSVSAMSDCGETLDLNLWLNVGSSYKVWGYQEEWRPVIHVRPLILRRWRQNRIGLNVIPFHVEPQLSVTVGLGNMIQTWRLCLCMELRVLQRHWGHPLLSHFAASSHRSKTFLSLEDQASLIVEPELLKATRSSMWSFGICWPLRNKSLFKMTQSMLFC